MYDEPFRDFKNYFFKVQAVEGTRPFFLESNNEPTFPLCWQKKQKKETERRTNLKENAEEMGEEETESRIASEQRKHQ